MAFFQSIGKSRAAVDEGSGTNERDRGRCIEKYGSVEIGDTGME